MTDSALQRARERALGEPENGLRKPASVNPSPQRFAEITQRGRQYRVPDPQFFDLAPEKQKWFLDSLDEASDQKAGETLFDRTALAVSDQQIAQAKRITSLESQLGTAVVVIERLQERLDQMDLEVKVSASNALAEQQVELAQQTVNLQAIGAEQEANHQRRMQESDSAARDQEERLATSEQRLKDFEGRLTSSGRLFQGLTNDLKDQTAKTQNSMQVLQRDMAGASDQLEAIGNPPSRAEISAMVESSTAATARQMLPDLVDQRLAEDRESGVYSPGGMSKDRAAVEKRREDAKRLEAVRYGDDAERRRLKKGFA